MVGVPASSTQSFCGVFYIGHAYLMSQKSKKFPHMIRWAFSSGGEAEVTGFGPSVASKFTGAMIWKLPEMPPPAAVSARVLKRGTSSFLWTLASEHTD